jgi:hypothetical protein
MTSSAQSGAWASREGRQDQVDRGDLPLLAPDQGVPDHRHPPSQAQGKRKTEEGRECLPLLLLVLASTATGTATRSTTVTSKSGPSFRFTANDISALHASRPRVLTIHTALQNGLSYMPAKRKTEEGRECLPLLLLVLASTATGTATAGSDLQVGTQLPLHGQRHQRSTRQSTTRADHTHWTVRRFWLSRARL